MNLLPLIPRQYGTRWSIIFHSIRLWLLVSGSVSCHVSQSFVKLLYQAFQFLHYFIIFLWKIFLLIYCISFVDQIDLYINSCTNYFLLKDFFNSFNISHKLINIPRSDSCINIIPFNNVSIYLIYIQVWINFCTHHFLFIIYSLKGPFNNFNISHKLNSVAISNF